MVSKTVRQLLAMSFWFVAIIRCFSLGRDLIRQQSIEVLGPDVLLVIFGLGLAYLLQRWSNKEDPPQTSADDCEMRT